MVTISTLRSDLFYFFGVTPHEIIKTFDWHLKDNAPSNKIIRLPSIPIDCLNDAEIVEKFVRR